MPPLPEDLLDDLCTHLLFQEIPREAVRGALEGCPVRRLEPDQVLLRPGEENHRLFLLVRGRVEIRLDRNDPARGFAMEAGECLGEMSIIDGSPVSAYVVAVVPSTLVAVPEAHFWARVAAIPGVPRNLLRLLTQRMRRQNEVTRRSLEQELRMEQMAKELQHAQAIQLSMLPNRRHLLPEVSQVELAALMRPAREVGGDLYDVIAIDERRVALVVGDVSGKGMAAALFMVKTLTLLRAEFHADTPLDVVVTRVNGQLCEANEGAMFVTLFVTVLDLESGLITYIHGGHNPPLLTHRDGRMEFLPLPAGLVAGVQPEATYEVNQRRLEPGDLLVLYSDGITEARNGAGAFYGEARLQRAVAAGLGGFSEDVLEAIHADVQAFVDGVEQSDDITLLVLRYLGG